MIDHILKNGKKKRFDDHWLREETLYSVNNVQRQLEDLMLPTTCNYVEFKQLDGLIENSVGGVAVPAPPWEDNSDGMAPPLKKGYASRTH
jgi:hypothetical protein